MIMNVEGAVNLTDNQWNRLLEIGRSGECTLEFPEYSDGDVTLIQNGQVYRINHHGDYSCRELYSA